jgi:hypothetical protein
MRGPFVARRSRRCAMCEERIWPGQQAYRMAQHRYYHERHLDELQTAVRVALPALSALLPRMVAYIREGIEAFQSYTDAALAFNAAVSGTGTVWAAILAQGPVFLTCRGCRRAWWSDQECECACQPGDPDYEAWVEVGP